MLKKIKPSDLHEFKEIAREYIGEGVLKRLEEDYSKFHDLFLADFQDGEMVGIIFGRVEGSTAVISGVAVLSEYWGKGIGRKLVKAFEENAKKLGARKASVGAALKPTNVVGFYEKQGYSVAEKKKQYWVMEKALI